MTTSNFIVPDPRRDERGSINFQEPWWQQAEERWNPVFTITNVKFAHDPYWRTRLFSIQNAHDWQHSLFWTCVMVAFVLSQFSVVAGWVLLGLLK